MSPFQDTTNVGRSVTPDNFRNAFGSMSKAEPENPAMSQRRLVELLRREQGEQDTLNRHYHALQQNLSRNKYSRSPIRGHEIDLAALNQQTFSVNHIQAAPVSQNLAVA